MKREGLDPRDEGRKLKQRKTCFSCRLDFPSDVISSSSRSQFPARWNWGEGLYQWVDSVIAEGQVWTTVISPNTANLVWVCAASPSGSPASFKAVLRLCLHRACLPDCSEGGQKNPSCHGDDLVTNQFHWCCTCRREQSVLCSSCGLCCWRLWGSKCEMLSGSRVVWAHQTYRCCTLLHVWTW